MSKPEERPGLSSLDLAPGYDSGDRALVEFYIPCLSRAVSYDRSVGYFRASALSIAAQGMARFIAGGGTARFLVGAEVAEHEIDALEGAAAIPQSLVERLEAGLATADEVAEQRLAVLAWLVREGRLEIRVAVAVDPSGRPVPAGPGVPYFHEKIGVLRDSRGDGVAFQGSVNESAQAWGANFESFAVFPSWGPVGKHFDHWAQRFDERWAGAVPGFKVYPLPEAVHASLIARAPDEPPVDRDPAEPPAPVARGLLETVLAVAPRTVGGAAIADATTGVTPFPHQRQVAERLAAQFPRSWLVADEVGLGKTISAGIALRRLLLSGQVKRALILAPANVCRQWQDELFEKFGLWVPRLDGGRIHGAHPDDVTHVPAGANPYAEHPVLIASSHTARRAEHQQLVTDAGPYDLLVVDEAHHARRQGFADLSEYRPSRLLRLLDRLQRANLTRTVWLLTATPMQVHPVELRDLLVHVGLEGELAGWQTFRRYYKQLALPDSEVNWAWLSTVLAGSSLPDLDPSLIAYLDGVASKLGPVAREHLESFERSADAANVARQLGPDGRERLREWLRLRGPVGQCVTRHSRATLRVYREQGVLSEPIATRDVQPVPITFGAEERELYERLDDLIDRLMSAHGSRQGAGFVLTVYRRRLTSSWAAIKRTLERRLAHEELVAETEGEWLDETADEDWVAEQEAVPLSDADLEEVKDFLAGLGKVADSKFDRLRHDLDRARGERRSTIVFTQFVDTMLDLRDRLRSTYESQLATFDGSGGKTWRPEEGWTPVGKQELVDALRSGRVTVLLATDAASEGINLQACSSLINYDLPWNPMRVEQRIGRIDRIGQQTPVVTVRNYTIPGTVEEEVYRRLALRIDDFADLLGNLQPILGQTERAFRRIFRAPRSEREKVLQEQLAALDETVLELRDGGIELSVEDPLPVPPPDPPLIDLEQLQQRVVDDLGIELGEPAAPITLDPRRASRDATTFAALATYGHPRMAGALLPDLTAIPDQGPVAIEIDVGAGVAALVRADVVPPRPVHSIDELGVLGPPVSAGEAQDLARRLVAEEVKRRGEQVDRWLGRSEEQWRAGVRRQFVALVAEAIAVIRELDVREHGTSPDPVLVWHGLGQDSTNELAYAEAFRRMLGIELETLLAATPELDPSSRSRIALQRRRVQLGKEVADLMKRWRDRASD